MADILTLQGLIEFLEIPSNLQQVHESLSRFQNTSRITFERALLEALREAGFSADLTLIEEFISKQTRLKQYFQNQIDQWARNLTGHPLDPLRGIRPDNDIFSSNPTEDFLAEIDLNARDPFRAVKSFATNFQPLQDINNLTRDSRLNSARTFHAYQGVIDYQTGRLEKTINQESPLFKSLDSRSKVYGESSGYFGRATETDYFNIFAGSERNEQGFRGSFFQLQETNTMAALYNRRGKTDIATQVLSRDDFNDAADSNFSNRMDILAGNSLTANLARTYGRDSGTGSNLSITPVTMATGSIHAKMGYFYEGDDYEDEDAITSILISTQNITPTLARTTTIEDMLLINKPIDNVGFRLQREEESDEVYAKELSAYNNRRSSSFKKLSSQIKIASDTMLSLMATAETNNTSFNRSRQFIREFTGRITKSYAAGADDRSTAGGVFANHEILPALQGVIKGAVESKGRYVTISMQYLEQALVKRSVLGDETFGHLEKLAEEGRLRIGISGSSIGKNQGLFYMLDALTGNAKGEQQVSGKGRSLITSLIKNDAFTLLPSQLQHSKSLAVFEKGESGVFKLLQYFIGSANISESALTKLDSIGTTKNIEVSMLLQGDYLELLSEQDQQNITTNYLHGIGQFGRSLKAQGGLVERKGDSKQVNRAIELLKAIGGVDARVAGREGADAGLFSYARRYVLDPTSEEGFRLTGLDIVINSPHKGGKGYTLGVTIGSEYKFVSNGLGSGRVQEVPVLFINKTQRMISGTVYKNASKETINFVGYNLETNKVDKNMTIQRGVAYEANALDFLAGLVSTMHAGMRYDAEVRSLVTTFNRIENTQLLKGVEQMLTENILASYKLINNNKNLMRRANSLASVLGRVRKLKKEEARRVLTQTAVVLGTHGWKGSEAVGGQYRGSVMQEMLVNKLMDQLFADGLQKGAMRGISQELVGNIFGKIEYSLGLTNRNAPEANDELGLYSDLALDLIRRTDAGYDMYRAEIEEGRGQTYHRILDAYQQPHTQNYSHGQALHALPVTGLTNVVHQRLGSFMQSGGSGLILNPYSLMHGEVLGTFLGVDGEIIPGEFLRAVGKGAGRAENELYFEAYGGLQKIEGGAPIVYSQTGLAASMPTLTAIKRKDFTARTKKLLRVMGKAVDNAEAMAEQLTSNAFDMFESAEGIEKGIDPENQVLYYFPYAKTEQISQRMKNLTATRPMFDASNSFIKYALSFGTSNFKEFDRDATKIIDGALPGSLPEQQFQTLKEEYKKRYDAWKNNGSKGLAPTYLEIAKELALDSRNIGKGYIGSNRPRLIAIVSGATQLSDYGVYNPNYGRSHEGRVTEETGGYDYGMKYLKPHPIQVSGTLSGTRTSPVNLLAKVKEYLQPGTIFTARDQVIENTDLLNKYASDLATLIKQNMGAGAETEKFSITSGQLTEETILRNAEVYYKRLDSSKEASEADIKTLAFNALQTAKRELVSRHKQLRLGYEEKGGAKHLVLKLKKGVYRPGGMALDAEGLHTPLESIGTVEGSDSQFTLRAFSIFDGDREYTVEPLKIAVTAFSGRELNAITVLGDVDLISNTHNTFLLNMETYTVEDFMSGMRPGTIFPKGPLKGGSLELFETLADLYGNKVQTELLPNTLQRKTGKDGFARYTAEDIFAYLAPSQIKGFNFEMGLGLLTRGDSSPIVNRLKDGKQLAQSLSLLFLGKKADSVGGTGNLQLLMRSLANSLDADSSQYATTLKIKADRLGERTSGTFTKFKDEFHTAGLSMFSALGGLVDIEKGEGLESAILRTVITALGNDSEATAAQSKLASGVTNLMSHVFGTDDYHIKEGDKLSLLDTFETKPLGLLAFLAKASSDLYQNIDLKQRANIKGLGEVVLSNRNIFDNLSDSFEASKKAAGLDGIIAVLNKVKASDGNGAYLRRELYQKLQLLSKLTGGQLAEAEQKRTLLEDNKLTRYTEQFVNLIQQRGSYNQGPAPLLELEEITHSGGVARAVQYLYHNETRVNLYATDRNEGASIYQAVIKNLTSTLSADGATYSHRQVLDLLAKRDEGILTLFRKSLTEELSKLHAQPGEPSIVIQELLDNNSYGLSSLEAIQNAVNLFKDGDPILDSSRKGTLGFYSALEAYAGIGGTRLQQAQQTLVNAFGQIIPSAKQVRAILDKRNSGRRLSDDESAILQDAEFSLAAISGAIQQQRAILMPAEFAMSKIATPTGSKNSTALEGHLARSMTKKQLNLYTYSPNEYTDVGSVQEALFVLARVYEGILPSNEQISRKYQLQRFNLAHGAQASAYLGLTQPVGDRGVIDSSKVISTAAAAHETIIDYLAEYNPMFRSPLKGETDVDPGMKLLLDLTKGTKKDTKQHMERVNQIVLGEIGSASLSYEEQLDRRVQLLAEYIYDQRGGKETKLKAIKEVTDKLRTLKSVNLDRYFEDVKNTANNYSELEQRAAAIWEENKFSEGGLDAIIDRIEGQLMAEDRDKEIRDISMLGGLRSRIKQVQGTNEGKAYLEAVKSQYDKALQQFNYSGRSDVKENAARQMGLLKSSRFIALPSYNTVGSDFSGNLTIKRAAGEGLTTGVILGLDVLEKMSLLFQTDSHPALATQHRLITQLSKTQSIINRVETEMFNTGRANITAEEQNELLVLRVLMEESKRATVDIMQNKNSIRQSTANRLNMMGASYIAINSLLVGNSELALGSRSQRHTGEETIGGTFRYVGSTRLSINKLNELMYNPYERKFLSVIYKQARDLRQEIQRTPSEERRAALEKEAQAWENMVSMSREERLTLLNNRATQLQYDVDTWEYSTRSRENSPSTRAMYDVIKDKKSELRALESAREIVVGSKVFVATIQNKVSWEDVPELAGARDLMRHVKSWAEARKDRDHRLPAFIADTQSILDSDYIDKSALISWLTTTQSLHTSISNKNPLSALRLDGLTMGRNGQYARQYAEQEEVVKKNALELRSLISKRQELIFRERHLKNEQRALRRNGVNAAGRRRLNYIKAELDTTSRALKEMTFNIKAARARHQGSLNYLAKINKTKSHASSILSLLKNPAIFGLMDSDDINNLRSITEKLLKGNNIELKPFLDWQNSVLEVFNKYRLDFGQMLPDDGLDKIKSYRDALRRTTLEFNTIDRLKSLQKEAQEEKRLRKTLRARKEKIDRLKRTLAPLSKVEKGLREIGDNDLKDGETHSRYMRLTEEKERLNKNKTIIGAQSRLYGSGGRTGLIGQQQMDQKRYDKIQSRAKSYSGLIEWASRLRDLAKAYGNSAYTQIDAAYVLNVVEHSGSRLDLAELSIITGTPVTPQNKKEVLSELERKNLLQNTLNVRSGAPYGSYDASKDPASGLVGYDTISSDTDYNQRVNENNSLFGTDPNSSATLMMTSAFGFQFTGLGDFDGDSYQVALTSITKIQGEVARISDKLKRSKESLTRARDALTKATTKEEESRIHRHINTLSASIKQLEADKLEQQKTLEDVRQQNREASYEKVDGAKKGVRSYISDYLALPSYLIGSNDDGDRVAFTDSQLAGAVKQYRDTLGGFYDRQDDTSNVTGAFAYATLDGEEVSFKEDQLKVSRSEAETARVIEEAKTWHNLFKQYGSEDGTELDLEGMDIEEYKTKITDWITNIEAAQMTMSTTKKIIGNASGSQISSVDLNSIQSLMGQTGGGLLGKVYNTVVPSVTNQISNLLMNRLMTNPVALEDFQNSVEATLGKVSSSKGTNQAILVSTLEKIQHRIGKNDKPWELIQKQQEAKSAAAYRFLLSTQQFLRDAALKPKTGLGLVEQTAKYKLSNQAKEQIQKLGIQDKSFNKENLSKLVGYDQILRLEAKARLDSDAGRQFLEIVSQDFLGSAANTVLNTVYQSPTSHPDVIDQKMTSFAMLRLITDYASGSGMTAEEMLDSDKSLYADALKGARGKLTDLAREDKKLAEKLDWDGTGQVSADATVKHVIVDLIGKFQSDFILNSVMEKQERTSIEQTVNALRSYGIELKTSTNNGNAAQFNYNKNNEKLQATVNYRLEEDVAAYNRSLGLKGDDQITTDLIQLDKLQRNPPPPPFPGTPAEDYSEEQTRLAELTQLDTRLRTEKGSDYDKALTDLRGQRDSYTDELERIQGKLSEMLDSELEAINSRLGENKLSVAEANQLITQGTFRVINEDTVQEQAQYLVEQIAKVKEFNKQVSDIGNRGITSDLQQALYDAATESQKALLSDAGKTGLFSANLQATAYATDTGKLTNENLYRAFSTGLIALNEAVTNQINENKSFSQAEAAAVFSYLSMGGVLPEPIQSAYEQGIEQVRQQGTATGLEDEAIEKQVGKFQSDFLVALSQSSETKDDLGNTIKTASILQTIAENSGFVAASAGWVSILEQSTAMLDNQDMLSAEEAREYQRLSNQAVKELDKINNRAQTAPAPQPPTITAPVTPTIEPPDSGFSANQTPDVIEGNVEPPQIPITAGNNFDVPQGDSFDSSVMIGADLSEASLGSTPEATFNPPQTSTESTPEVTLNTPGPNPESTPEVVTNSAPTPTEATSAAAAAMRTLDHAQIKVEKLTRKVENRHEVHDATIRKTNREKNLRGVFATAEVLSLLAVPTIFATLQGNIPLGEQAVGLASDAVQSFLTMGSFEQSTIGSIYRQDSVGMENMQLAFEKMQRARMRDYFRHYESPTEALARGFGNELMIRGMGVVGNKLGTLFDDLRNINPLIAGETGAGRVITEVAAGMVGRVVGGAISGAPVGNYNTTQTDLAMAVMEQAAKSVQTIQNYLMDSLSSFVTDMEDEFNNWTAQEEESGTTLAMDDRESDFDADPNKVASALSTAEYLHLLSVDNETTSTAQELGIQEPDGLPRIT